MFNPLRTCGIIKLHFLQTIFGYYTYKYNTIIPILYLYKIKKKLKSLTKI